jgi:hypothetical protein
VPGRQDNDGETTNEVNSAACGTKAHVFLYLIGKAEENSEELDSRTPAAKARTEDSSLPQRSKRCATQNRTLSAVCGAAPFTNHLAPKRGALPTSNSALPSVDPKILLAHHNAQRL